MQSVRTQISITALQAMQHSRANQHNANQQCYSADSNCDSDVALLERFARYCYNAREICKAVPHCREICKVLLQCREICKALPHCSIALLQISLGKVTVAPLALARRRFVQFVQFVQHTCTHVLHTVCTVYLHMAMIFQSDPVTNGSG